MTIQSRPFRATRRTLRRLLAGTAVAAGTLVAQPSLAEEPTGPAIEYRPDEYPPSSARTSTLLAGAGVFAASYGIGFGTSYLWPDAPTAPDLRLPVVGPWMALAGAKCGAKEAECDTLSVAVRSIFATLSGIGQIGGVLVMAEALFLPTGPAASAHAVLPGTSLDDALRPTVQLVRPPEQVSAEPTSVYASPLLSETAVGLSVGGAF